MAFQAAPVLRTYSTRSPAIVLERCCRSSDIYGFITPLLQHLWILHENQEPSKLESVAVRQLFTYWKHLSVLARTWIVAFAMQGTRSLWTQVPRPSRLDERHALRTQGELTKGHVVIKYGWTSWRQQSVKPFGFNHGADRVYFQAQRQRPAAS